MKIDYTAIQDIYKPQPKPLSKGPGKYMCISCKKTLDEKQFFKTNRADKFPSGYLPICKTCATIGVVDNDPSTFLPILKEIDIPYIPTEWRNLAVKKTPKSPSIIGKYASKMRLNNFKRYSWADTATLVEREESALLEALRQESDTESEAEEKLKEMMEMTDIPTTKMEATVSSAPAAFTMTFGLTPETSKYGLTQEEINDLKITWGSEYSEDEYLKLEQLFQDLKTAYVIQDPVAVSNIRIICKMTVKMNKYLDIDDIESASKLSRQLDLFIKTANLAPVQQKDRQQTTFAISQLAFLVEREGGFIPEYYIEHPNDKIDMVLRDMQDYTEALVRGESNIGEMVENAADILAKDKLPEAVQDFSDFGALEREILGDIEAIEATPEEGGDN